MVKAIRKLSLIQKIMIGIVIGTTLGFLVPEWTFISVLGELFVGALKAIAPILVFVLIIASLAQQKGWGENICWINFSCVSVSDIFGSCCCRDGKLSVSR